MDHLLLQLLWMTIRILHHHVWLLSALETADTSSQASLLALVWVRVRPQGSLTEIHVYKYGILLRFRLFHMIGFE